MTNSQVESLKVGSRVRMVLASGRFSEPRVIRSIYARGVSVNGSPYVCGYVEWGPNARLSFSVAGGESFAVEAVEEGSR